MRCEHRHLGGPGNFGFTWKQCHAQRGLRSWWSEDRTWLHVACPAHYVELRWRYPAADLPEAPAWDLPVETVVFPDAADWLEGADPLTEAKAWLDRESWTLTR